MKRYLEEYYKLLNISIGNNILSKYQVTEIYFLSRHN